MGKLRGVFPNWAQITVERCCLHSGRRAVRMFPKEVGASTAARSYAGLRLEFRRQTRRRDIHGKELHKCQPRNP